MDIHSFYENIKSQAEAINVNLNNEMCEQFYYYMKLMLEWNENINLTAIIEEDEIILKHFVDSLTINKYIQTKNKVIDIGTGTGIVSILLCFLFHYN